MKSNLPPGVSDSMIPGNSPEDEAWEKLIDHIMGEGKTSAEALLIWEIGTMVVEGLRAKRRYVFSRDEIKLLETEAKLAAIEEMERGPGNG